MISYLYKKSGMNRILLLFIAAFLIISPALAQEQVTDSIIGKLHPPVQKFYVGGGIDGALFSIATIQRTTTNSSGVTETKNTTGKLRFSYFFNFGFTFNFNVNRHLGLFTGIDVKNLGYIEEINGVTIKRRTYNAGIPLGIKIGNMARRGNYLFLGGGVDAPVNYREKSFVIRDQKTKFNEWFSDRTPRIMPYLFAGVCLHKGVTLKAQYYLDNFLNPGFTKDGIQPYSALDVHVMYLSLGVATHYSRKHDIVKEHVSKLQTM
jgi:hypothetical protein